MRILRFLAISSVVMLMLSLVVGLIGREALLVWGVATMRTEVSKLRQISKKPAAYSSQCLQKGVQPDEDAPLIESYQLRFVSDTEFVTEVVCRQFRLDPIRVSSGQLPWFVRKVPGSSGLIWGQDSSAVELEVLGRHRTVLVEATELLYDRPGLVRLGEGPVASCQGYGFSCCELNTQQGMGDQLNGVTDCPRTCFRSCLSRPVVLSFSSDPFPDPQTRVAVATVGEPVTFSYVTDVSMVDVPIITIVFGDGAEQVVTEPVGSVGHSYQCATAMCQFQARVVISSPDGVTAAELPVNSLTLQVTP